MIGKIFLNLTFVTYFFSVLLFFVFEERRDEEEWMLFLEEKRRWDKVERLPDDFFFKLECFFDELEEQQDEEVDFLDKLESTTWEAVRFSSSCHSLTMGGLLSKPNWSLFTKSCAL